MMSVATDGLVTAERELAEYVRRIRLDNAEAILEAKSERTASLYLEGLLHTDGHHRLEADREHTVCVQDIRLNYTNTNTTADQGSSNRALRNLL